MGVKNTTDRSQQEITEIIRKPPERAYIETIEDDRLKLFTELCILQRDGKLLEYRLKLVWNRINNRL